MPPALLKSNNLTLKKLVCNLKSNYVGHAYSLGSPQASYLFKIASIQPQSKITRVTELSYINK